MERDGPLSLIEIRYEAGKAVFALGETAEVLLNSLGETALAIVGIAGPARTGKSFLCNVLLERMEGFPMGSSTTPCTKGIWLWGRPHVVEGLATLVFDTEGLHSQQRDATTDAAILGLTILLSSVFVYNSFGVVDEARIGELATAINLTKWAKEATSAPFLLWCLRDFAFDLREYQTADQYLAATLAPANFPYQSEQQSFRRALCAYFPRRGCQAFVRPLADEAEVRAVDRYAFGELRPKFRAASEAFRARVGAELTPKCFDGRPLTGPGLVRLLAALLESVNAQRTPQVKPALERLRAAESAHRLAQLNQRTEDIIRNANEKAVEKAVRAVLETVQSAREGESNGVNLLDGALKHLVKSIGESAERVPVCADALNAALNDEIDEIENVLNVLRGSNCDALPTRFVVDRLFARVLRQISQRNSLSQTATKSEINIFCEEIENAKKYTKICERKAKETEIAIAELRVNARERVETLQSLSEQIQIIEKSDNFQLEKLVSEFAEQIESLESEIGSMKGISSQTISDFPKNVSKTDFAELNNVFDFVEESYNSQNGDLRESLEKLSRENTLLKANSQNSRQRQSTLEELRERVRRLRISQNAETAILSEAEKLENENAQLEREKNALIALIAETAAALKAKRAVAKTVVDSVGLNDIAEILAIYKELKVRIS